MTTSATGSSTADDDLVMPHRPDVDGLRFRRWTGFGDLNGMAAANQLERDEARQEEVVNLAEMTRHYEHLDHCDLSKDLVIVERHGRTIGYVRVEWNDMTNGERQFFSFCVLDPAQRGLGIGQAMLSWSEARLGEIVETVPADRPGQLHAFTFDQIPAAGDLLERNGWARVARGYEMVRPTLDDVADVPLPDGIVVRAVDASERRLIWEAARDAFRDHRDEPEWTEEQWVRFAADSPDTSLWAIAFDGDEVAGGIWNRINANGNAHHGRARGELGGIWTGSRWRRRGLARALIARSLVMLRDRGMTSAYLGVDGANPNQAMDLYASCGFEVASSTTDWHKALPGGDGHPATTGVSVMSTSTRIERLVPGLEPTLGLIARPFRDAADYAPMAALMGVANANDGIPWLPTEETFRSEIAGADGLVPETDIVLVEGPDGLAAFALVERAVRDGVPTYDLLGYVRPDLRRRGIGGALYERNMARVAERVLLEDPDIPVFLQAHAEESEAGHRAILEGHGFAPVRHFFLMRRVDLHDLPDVALPDGLELRPVRPADHRAIWLGEREAFLDHWGARVLTDHDFEVTFSQSALDTDLWAVAWDGDEVAGVVQSWIWAEENDRLDVQRGWLERISVRRPWRKRGLGRALTAVALARLREAGMTEAMLGVDAENPTGALGLYERLGFEVTKRSVVYRLELAPVPSPRIADTNEV